MKTGKFPALWKPSSGSSNQLPWGHFYIHHRQNLCLHEQAEASHWDITHQPKAKAFLFQNYPWLPPWCIGVKCCPYKTSIQTTLVCTWVLVFCRDISKARTKPEHFFLLSLCILYSLPWNLAQKRIFTNSLYWFAIKESYFRVYENSLIRSVQVIQYRHPVNWTNFWATSFYFNVSILEIRIIFGKLCCSLKNLIISNHTEKILNIK